MTHQHPAQVRTRARIDDIVHILAAICIAALLAALRRLTGRRRRRGWSFGFEVAVAATRGCWSVMPRIGIVRWRNVSEHLSSLDTDGLEPHFVHHEGSTAAIDAAWLEPPNTDDAVLLYFHGGGFVFGSLRTHGTLIAALARATRARTLALDYRLAPAAPAPAALEDALAAYHYLLATGIPAQRIVLAGDSAGGTLTLTTLLALRDAGEPLPAAAVAISPWVDLACSGASFQTNAPFDYVGKRHCQLAAAEYLAGANPQTSSISPLFANLARLPPLLVQVGECEVLVDQVRAFAERAQADGVEVHLSVYSDMVHVWHTLPGVTLAAQEAISEIGAFVRSHAMGVSSTPAVARA